MDTLLRDLVAFSVQIALVTVAIAVLLKVVRIPARVRYVGLRVALVALLVTPWLLRVPENRPVAEPGNSSLAAPASPQSLAAGTSAHADETSLAAPRSWNIPWTPVLLGALLSGVATRGLWLVVGFARLRRVTRLGTVVDADYAELQQQMGTRATITEVVGVAQPATYGIRRPVVMLPHALTAAPESVRRAVITHELFHVRRRDWLSVVAEEMVRTLLWFHPAILWLTSHIQLAREEIVDELTVRTTGDRRTYMQALLSFADTPGLSHAPAFAHRRQLFHRILSVSKENVMSRPRIVTCAAALTAAVFTASWYASTLFPIVTASVPMVIVDGRSHDVRTAVPVAPPVSARLDGAAAAQGAPPAQGTVLLLDQRGGAVVTPRQVTPENPIPRRTRGGNPAWPVQFEGRRFHVLVQALVTLDRNGVVIAVDRGGCQIFERPAIGEQNDAVCHSFQEVSADAIRQWRYDRPVQAPLQFTVLATFLPGSAPTISQTGSDLQRYLRETPESVRVPATDTGRASSVATQEQLARQLEQSARQLESSRRQPEPTVTGDVRLTPTTPLDQSPPLRSPSGRAPIRVGGGVQSLPRVLKSVHPQYSLEAMQARLQGTVQVEALIDEQGRVADVRVLKSLPMLDDSALSAARQWEFTPTLLNGQPVPVIVMLEMHFTLK
jgi:TonB family protein